ncbi:RluA family pseudouridine synthase [Candidatus Dojkabacteria bacterium]|uniref:Pseudouridine synthase n=1 Tax=Candidatus Dojkabacteria bacterium TaxID=2099670 RepID=A0A955L6H4_9BACT|nr:RluA family pseudouridine synthase [Candidatus Dojkabacteria bacterium]
MKITVTEENNGERLDLFLTKVQNEFSRSAVKKQLNDAVVKVNDEVEYRPNYKVKLGDIIEFNFIQEELPTEIVPQDMPLDIVYEDKDLLVINKPVGLVVHPATGNWEGTLMNAVAYHYKEQHTVGDNIRSGLIHRLDKDTSGLVLIGKTNKGLWYYSKLFAERKVKKTYLVVVRGDLRKYSSKSEFTVRNYLGRNTKNRKKFTDTDEQHGKIAETKFIFRNIIEIEGKVFSLVEAKPHTGRTHQIRVHLSSIGHPVLGDVIYGRVNKYKRLMLHAWKLSLTGLNGEELKFEAEIPEEFLEINA